MFSLVVSLCQEIDLQAKNGKRCDLQIKMFLLNQNILCSVIFLCRKSENSGNVERLFSCLSNKHSVKLFLKTFRAALLLHVGSQFDLWPFESFRFSASENE